MNGCAAGDFSGGERSRQEEVKKDPESDCVQVKIEERDWRVSRKVRKEECVQLFLSEHGPT
jgi:hypothetical protein